MNNIEIVLNNLSKSKFRSSFHLRKYMIKYIDDKGLETIRKHTYDFVNQRLRIKPTNDGKQTPMKGHPTFIAQHACACCCRSCLYKWHGIATYKELNEDEVNYIVDLIMKWIEKEYNSK